MSISQIRHDTTAPTVQAARPPRRVRLRPLLLAALGSAALTAAGTVVQPGTGGPGWLPVSAANDTSNPASRYCQDFVGHLASDLGIGSSKVQAAMARAARQTLDDAVANGDLTSKQAGAIKARIAHRPICNADLSGIGGAAAQARGVVLDATALSVGRSPDEVRTQLAHGKSVSQLAPAGMTEEQFAASLQTNLKTALDAKVKDGTITQAQEDQAMSRVPALAERLWTKGAPAALPTASPSGP
jgi:hypothetical protein